MRNRIKHFRKAAGITQVELGSLTGLDQRRISYYESGNRQPALDHCRLVVAALNKFVACSLDDVFPPQTEQLKAG